MFPTAPISFRDLIRVRGRKWRWDDRLGVWTFRNFESVSDSPVKPSSFDGSMSSTPSAVVERTADVIPDRNSLMKCYSYTAAETLMQLFIFCLFAILSTQLFSDWLRLQT
jgi:hypothetical protein